MSDIQTKTAENGVLVLKENLREMPENMHIFSLSMRALYTDKAVGTSTNAARKFRKLRDDTRNDAMVYLKCILPVTTKFVMSIKEYFANYDALSYEEWCEMLPDILEETTKYKELAQTVKGMYEGMMVSLKKREDQAKLVMTSLKDLQLEYEKQKQQLEATAKTKMSWAVGLAFIPCVNMIATPWLAAASNADYAKAIAKQAESHIHEAAALVVAETLIPALANFIEGLTKTAGFFQVMETELQSFEEKSGIEYPKKLHYKRITNEAKELKSLCQAFYAVIPAVRTDFEAIPDEDTDQNYVDKWLDRHLAKIGEKRSSMVRRFLLRVLKGIKG